MANKKLSEGVGKKIVEALKKQSEIEITPVPAEAPQEELESLSNQFSNSFENETIEDSFQEEDLLDNLPSEDFLENLASSNESASFASEPSVNIAEPNQTFVNYQQPIPQVQDNFIKELDNFEIPGNIAVLKKLIAQLPSGVTRHTGAQIIKQTMEALGISMKSVLQEAQQVQDSLNNSAKECYSTIQEYKKQIVLLERQAQNHQKQYAALNELISLFIQTGV